MVASHNSATCEKTSLPCLGDDIDATYARYDETHKSNLWTHPLHESQPLFTTCCHAQHLNAGIRSQSAPIL
jgi:hypothetical protein